MLLKKRIVSIIAAMVFAFGIMGLGMIFTNRSGLSADARGAGVSGNGIITDASFEETSAENKGNWVFYTESAQGAGGKIEVAATVDAEGENPAVINSSDGAQSIHMQATKAEWPEIYQIIQVEANTDYYITMDLRNNDRLLTNQTNIFFGFANDDPANNVDIHQQQRWVDKTTKDFQKDTDPEFTKLKSVLNTGNNTSVRFFVRTNLSDINIDNITIAKNEGILPEGEINLLKQGGFEGSAAQNAAVWKPFGNGNVEEGQVKMGYDDYRNDADYKPSVKIQNKEIEGYKCLWIAYYAGATPEETYGIYQEVDVQPNTYYTFYVNMGKFKTIGKAEIGVYGADKEVEFDNVLKSTSIKDSNLYSSCYNLYSITINSGENTKLRPYVSLYNGTDSSWAWGAGILLDDLYFFNSANGDVPVGKENILQDGNFESPEATSPWIASGALSEMGFNQSDEFIKGYNSKNDAWISHWNADGFSQLVNLKAGTTYKSTMRVMRYGKAISEPVVIKIFDGEGTSIAKAAYDVNDNTAWLPVGLTFTVPADGEYEAYYGFEKNAGGAWSGGIDISAITLFEYDAPVVEIPKVEFKSGSDSVKVNGKSLEISVKDMKVETLKAALSVNPFYTLKITDDKGTVLENSATVVKGVKVEVLYGSEVVDTYTVKIIKKGGGCGTIAFGSGIFGGGLFMLAFGGIILLALKKRKTIEA